MPAATTWLGVAVFLLSGGGLLWLLRSVLLARSGAKAPGEAPSADTAPFAEAGTGATAAMPSGGHDPAQALPEAALSAGGGAWALAFCGVVLTTLGGGCLGMGLTLLLGRLCHWF